MGMVGKEVILEGNEWYSGRYLLKEWLWGAKNKVLSDCLDVDARTRKAKLDVAKYNARQLMAFIVEAPFEVTEEKINSLPSSIGDKLFREIREIAGELRPEELENLSVSLERDV